jgi:peptide deformylase
MAKLEIIKVPDPLLRKVSQPVEHIDDDLRRLLDDMLETMYAAPGIGLAAVQVGRPIRALVMDVAQREAKEGETVERRPIAMINPRILELGETTRTHEEGCLSIPDIYAEIERPATARVRYVDREGREQELLCEGLLSTVLQHEIDHLDGKLFIDYLGRLKRDMIIRKMVKQKRQAEAEA